MSDILKSVIQDLINDRTEQASVSIHQYIVNKTQQLAGLTENEDAKSNSFSFSMDSSEEGASGTDLASALEKLLKATVDAEEGGYLTSSYLLSKGDKDNRPNAGQYTETFNVQFKDKYTKAEFEKMISTSAVENACAKYGFENGYDNLKMR